MKEYEKRNLEVESNSDFESVDMSIAAEDMGFVFDIMFSQMYRDPIGSVIREITSNCFDSHIEAKVNDAVVITLAEDDGGDYISFKDVGIGISPDRMKKVYSKPAKSTKRDSNDFIGYWGLGSKSPLAYVEDGFEVITISNGIEYNYLVHKGKAAPQITLLTETPTTEHNGTTVKIYFKRPEDKKVFDSKLDSQLRYFDNVYVVGSRHFNNNYKLYEGKHFKYRNDCGPVGLHLAIGKVTYPIDWDKIGETKIDLPFALKFEIGDLPVTPERESIKYTSIKVDKDGEEVYVDTKDIIKEKIKLFKQELIELAGTEPVHHNNIFDYLDSRSSVASIILLGQKIALPKSIVPPRPQYYQPLHSVGIDLQEYTFFSKFEIKRALSAYSGSKMLNYHLGGSALSYSDFNNTFIVREFTSVSKFKSLKLDYLRKLAREDGKQTIYFVRERKVNLFKQVGLPRSSKLDYSRWNRLKLYKYYQSVVLKELILHSVDYDNLDIPKEFEDHWKLINAKTSNAVEADEGEILVDDLSISPKSEQRTKMGIEEFADYSFVIYGFEKDMDLLEKYEELFSVGKFSTMYKIIKIRQRDEKLIVLLKNVIKVTAFMSNNPIFRAVATAAYIRQSKLTDYNFAAVETRDEHVRLETAYTLLFYPMADKWMELVIKSRETVNLKGSNASTEELVQEMLELAKANGWLEDDVVKGVQKVEKYLQGLELLNYIVPSRKAIPHIANFVKLAGKPLNKEWEALEPWQKEFMQELQNKYKYVESVSDDKTHISYSLGSKVQRRMESARVQLKDNFQKIRTNYREVEIFNNYHNERVIKD